MFPLRILLIVILLFQFVLQIESSKTVIHYESDFFSADEYDSPNCKSEGDPCTVGECCHTLACRRLPGLYLRRRCQLVQNHVVFPSELMKRIKDTPFLKEGEDCKNDICEEGTSCFQLRDRTKRCMSNEKRLPLPPPAPPMRCLEKGENCATGECCEGNSCWTYWDGSKECIEKWTSEPTTAPDVQQAEPVLQPAAPVEQQTEPVLQPVAPVVYREPVPGVDCLAEYQYCSPGHCCNNLICHTFSESLRNRICKRVYLYITPNPHTHGPSYIEYLTPE